jgi:hypothetical protein
MMDRWSWREIIPQRASRENLRQNHQIEMWFSILVRKLLKRASFASVEDLTARVLAFVEGSEYEWNRKLG